MFQTTNQIGFRVKLSIARWESNLQLVRPSLQEPMLLLAKSGLL
jgi:hypothetical protein